jgi:hypothetical protein
MPATQSQPKFTAHEADRFAALMAGFDTGNPSDAEAVGKAKALRRMASAAGLRVIDALELPEVRHALDEQMHPVRHQGDASALQAENEDLRARLAVVVPKVTELAESLKRAQDEPALGCLWMFVVLPLSLIVTHYFLGTSGVAVLLSVVVVLCWIGREQKL